VCIVFPQLLIESRIGLVIHPPDLHNRTHIPHFSLVRASATASNDNWYQKSSTISETEEPTSSRMPQWAETISRTVKLLVPQALANKGLVEEEDEDDSDDDFDLPAEAGEQVYPWRIRIWGLTISPGGGSTAVLVTQQTALHPERRFWTKVLFGWTARQTREDLEHTHPETVSVNWLPIPKHKLTTEALMWEWMYGGIDEVAGVTSSKNTYDPNLTADLPGSARLQLKEQFKPIIPTQKCAYCEEILERIKQQWICTNDHPFGTLFCDILRP
jgi:hypothetical protein